MAVWERRALLGIAFAAAACTGQVGSGEEESAESAGTLFPEVGLPPPALSPASIPRLTTAQYAQVMRDLFGAGIPLSTLEEDTRPGFFSVLGAAQTAASERTVSRFGAAAQEIARAVFEDPDRRTAVVACAAGSPPPPACAAEFLRRFGARAWRRPLTPEELGRYQDLFRFSAQGDPWRGLRYAVEAMLQSPYFLYRVERGTPDGDTPGHLKHDPWEIASRLAFLIRGGLPDAELNEAAASGALTEAEGVRAEAARLFDADDAGARAGLEHFLGEYLGFDEAARVPFPSGLASPGLRGSARAELEARVSDLLEKGRDYRTLFTSPGTFLNEDLARLYDVQGVTGAALRPVTLPESSPRAGLLTAAGILTRDPREERTSPTSRG
ncbi:MAG TPA: DUF1592 domain-containing protein, partial [Myxococcaceae bacterium]|nr:DUF1592 domain-containing protein [Myxococcaceae bacterium]